jgi:antitoxin component YwqK of YwqJK toxin-antitoxin module
MDIRRRIAQADGTVVTRSARITVEGQLVSEEIRRDGQMELSRGWYLNGQLAFIIPCKKGEPDGISFNYAPDGHLLQKIQWEKGKCMAAWNSKGEQTVKDGTGWTSEFNWYMEGGDGNEGGGDFYIDGEINHSVG